MHQHSSSLNNPSLLPPRETTEELKLQNPTSLSFYHKSSFKRMLFKATSFNVLSLAICLYQRLTDRGNYLCTSTNAIIIEVWVFRQYCCDEFILKNEETTCVQRGTQELPNMNISNYKYSEHSQNGQVQKGPQ